MPVNLPRVLQPTRAAAAALAAFVLVLFIALVWLLGQVPTREEMQLAGAAEIGRMAARMDRLLLAMVVLAAMMASLATAVFARMGRRTLASGEFPPPGTWVLRRTRVVTGRAARRAAWATFALAALSWLPVGAFAYARVVLAALAS